MCDTFSHSFEEEYYGLRCSKCGMFVLDSFFNDDRDVEIFEEEDYPSGDWLEEHQYDEEELAE